MDYHILWANLIFLFALSLIPYFVDYLGEKSFDTFSAILYDSTMIFAAATFLLLRRSVMRQQRQTGALGRTDVAELRRHLASLAVYLAALAAAFYLPWLSLALTGLVTLIWVLPGATVKTCEQDANALPNSSPR